MFKLNKFVFNKTELLVGVVGKMPKNVGCKFAITRYHIMVQFLRKIKCHRVVCKSKQHKGLRTRKQRYQYTNSVTHTGSSAIHEIAEHQELHKLVAEQIRQRVIKAVYQVAQLHLDL